MKRDQHIFNWLELFFSFFWNVFSFLLAQYSPLLVEEKCGLLWFQLALMIIVVNMNAKIMLNTLAINDLSCVMKKKQFWFDFIQWKLRKSRANPQKTSLTHIKREKLTRRKMIGTIYMHECWLYKWTDACISLHCLYHFSIAPEVCTYLCVCYSCMGFYKWID